MYSSYCLFFSACSGVDDLEEGEREAAMDCDEHVKKSTAVLEIISNDPSEKYSYEIDTNFSKGKKVSYNKEGLIKTNILSFEDKESLYDINIFAQSNNICDARVIITCMPFIEKNPFKNDGQSICNFKISSDENIQMPSGEIIKQKITITLNNRAEKNR
jgi:hypothetical protein